MSRKIIQINEEKCVGCGLCANACKQSAIEMVNGKAKVIHDDYCDGLGNCLPVCPVGAISFSDNDIKNTKEQPKVFPSGCPGTFSKTIERSNRPITQEVKTQKNTSQLNQWPVQIKLAPPIAPYFKNANLLIAADCTAFAYGNFHSDFMKNKITLIGCPKLDEGDYTDKLTKIIRDNDLKSVTIVRMEVPCCGGIESAVKNALIASGKMIPWQVVTITTDGKILD
ncbi:MAG: 4Fe-4S binding protein [Clostridia bacterium]